MARLLYFLGKALASLRESPGVSVLTSGTIAAALLVTGAYVMALQNLEQLAVGWGRAATLVAYVDDGVPREEWQAVRGELEKLPAVAQAVLVTPGEALERFRAGGPEAAALVEGVVEEALPAQVELQLPPGFADLEQVEQLAAAAAVVRGVGEVDYGQQVLEQLRALVELLRYGGLAAGLLVLAATAFIVSNTIRLTVYARRDEIAILRLVGATRWFVRTPFLFEGAIWGLAGGGAAAATLWLAEVAVTPRVSAAVAHVLGNLELHLFEPVMGASLVAAGASLGLVASYMAVGRFLDEESV